MSLHWFLVVALLLVPGLLRAGHEGRVIVVEAEATDVAPGTAVEIRAGVRDAAGTLLPEADQLRLTVVRTVQPAAGPAIYLQPVFRDLPPADLRVTAQSAEGVRAVVRMPYAPDALVTVEVTLPRGTPHDPRATLDLLATLPVGSAAGPAATPTPSPRTFVERLQRVREDPRSVPVVGGVLRLPQTVGSERSTAVAVTGAAVSTTTAAVSFLSLVPDLGFFLRHAGILLLSIFTGRRIGVGWGRVVESSLGRPLARAVVLLLDAAVRKPRASVLSGVNGLFAFAPPVGAYQIHATAPGYTFPARRAPPAPPEPGMRVYQGEILSVTEETLAAPPRLIVPLDRGGGDTPAAVRARTVVGHAIVRWARGLSPLLLFVGLVWNSLVLLSFPSLLAGALEVLYVLLIIGQGRVTLRRRRNFGRVLERTGGAPLALARVRAYHNETNRLAQTTVTAASGRFFLFLPEGVYTLRAEREGFLPAEETVAVARRAGAAPVIVEVYLSRLPSS